MNRKPIAVVVDIDGVISCNKHRIPHLRQDPPDWESFYRDAYKDPVIEQGRIYCRGSKALSITTILLTNRPEKFRQDTLAWLELHDIPFDQLIMRKDERVHDAKVRVILEEIVPKYHLLMAIDDDPQIIDTYVEAGLMCHYVDSGYYPTGKRLHDPTPCQ